jgi:hypothetical protein
MSMDYINVGTIANDGTGDDLRDAFLKVNANFNQLYSTSGLATEVDNLGTGTGIFKQKTDNVLELRSLSTLGAIRLQVVNDVIILDWNPTAPVDFKNQDIIGVDTISANSFDGVLDGNVVGLVRSGGDISVNPFVNINELDRTINTFDYGFIVINFNNPIAYLLHEIGTDMGTFTNPSPIDIDAGTI